MTYSTCLENFKTVLLFCYLNLVNRIPGPQARCWLYYQHLQKYLWLNLSLCLNFKAKKLQNHLMDLEFQTF